MWPILFFHSPYELHVSKDLAYPGKHHLLLHISLFVNIPLQQSELNSGKQQNCSETDDKMKQMLGAVLHTLGMFHSNSSCTPCNTNTTSGLTRIVGLLQNYSIWLDWK